MNLGVQTRLIISIFFTASLFATGLFFFTNEASAATCTWDGGGDGTTVSDADNWSGCPAGEGPNSDDDVVINSGSSAISWDANASSTVGSITLGGTYSGTTTLARDLTVNGTVAINAGEFNTGTKDITINNGSFTVAAEAFITSDGAGTTTIKTGDVMLGGAGSTTLANLVAGSGASNATTTLAGNVVATGRCYISAGFPEIHTLFDLDTHDLSCQGDLKVYAPLGVKLATIDFRAGSGTLTVGGDVILTSTRGFAAGGSDVNFYGETADLDFNGALTLHPDATNQHNIVFYAGSSGTMTVDGAVTITQETDSHVDILVFDAGGKNITMNGSFTAESIQEGGVYVRGGSSVWTIAGATILDASGVDRASTTFSGETGMLTFGGGLTLQNGTERAPLLFTPSTNTNDINGDLVIIDSEASLSTAELAIIDPGSAYELTISGDLRVVDGAGLASISLDLTNSSIIFDGTSGQKIADSGNHLNFNHLTMNNTGGSLIVASSTLDVNGDLALIDGTLDFATNETSLTVDGNLTVSSGGWTRGSTTVLTFDGTTTYTDNSGSFDLGELTIASSTAVASLTLGSNATSSGIAVGSGETLSLGSNTLYLTDATASGTPLTINGTFTPGTSTVTYKATSTATNIASTTYYNLTLDSGGNNNTFTLLDYTPVTTFTNTSGYLVESSSAYIANSSSLSLSSATLDAGDTLTITVTDSDENISATTTDSVSVSVTVTGDSENVTLTETGAATGIFTGTLSIDTTSDTSGTNDGTLDISNSNETITVAYTDAQDASDTASASATTGSLFTGSVSSGGGIVGLIGDTGYSGITGPYVTTTQGGTSMQTPQEPQTPTSPLTTQLTGPFTIGTTSEQTKILQQILATDPSLYPEGLTTGYYGTLTTKAVGRFQEKYNIVGPTHEAYGYAGPQTRAKIKEVFSTQQTPNDPQALLSQIAELTQLVNELQAQLQATVQEQSEQQTPIQQTTPTAPQTQSCKPSYGYGAVNTCN